MFLKRFKNGEFWRLNLIYINIKFFYLSFKNLNEKSKIKLLLDLFLFLKLLSSIN